MKISAFITLLVSLTTVSWSLAQEPTNTDTEAEITLETVIPETEDRDISAPKSIRSGSLLSLKCAIFQTNFSYHSEKHPALDVK